MIHVINLLYFLDFVGMENLVSFIEFTSLRFLFFHRRV